MNTQPDDLQPPEGYRAAMALANLKRSVLAVVDQAPDDIPRDERTGILLDAAADTALFADRWCPACQATAEGLCADHDAITDALDDARHIVTARSGARRAVD